MKHYRMTTPILVLLVAALLIVGPNHVSFAQEEGDVTQCDGTGVFYWPCRLLDGILSVIKNIVNFIVNIVTGFVDLVTNFIRWVFDTIGNVITFIRNIIELIIRLINEIFRLINEAIQIAILIVQIIVSFVTKLGGWLGQAVTLVIGFLTQFFSATPTALPGVPQCMSAPTSHDLCAIWYFLDNSVWAGSIGGLIVTLILIIIDVSVVFLFVQRVMTLLRMGESVTDVS